MAVLNGMISTFVITESRDPAVSEARHGYVPILRKEDIENHNREGGLWVVVQGRVYDLEPIR